MSYGREITVTTKVCRKCNVEKTAEEFGRAGNNADGLKSYCKPCEAEYKRPHQAKWKAAQRDRDNGNTLREKCRAETYKLIRKGQAKEPTKCIICGATHEEAKIEKHHTNYNNPKEFVGLCALHHRKIHALLRLQGGN